MEKIKCDVKLEGYEEIIMEFLTMPNKGEIISYNDELFEIKVIKHIILKTEEQNILIHASKTKRL